MPSGKPDSVQPAADRYPDDLDVFFRRPCAPRAKLPEKLEKELVSLLRDARVADLKRNPPKGV